MAHSKPLVSIGMPVYNGERFIRQALDSLLGQDYANIELTISDNASTDSTQEICLEYAARDNRIRYYRNQTNLGAFANFKRVLELAQGPYFMWAAHDDVWEPSAITSALSCFMTNDEIVFAWSHFDTINYVTGQTKDNDIAELAEVNNAFRNCCLLLGRPTPSFIYGLFRTDVLTRTRFVRTEFFDFGDLYLLYEIATEGRMQIVPALLFHAGVVESQRAPKSFARHRLPAFKFGYSRYYCQSLGLFLRSESFSCRQKLHLVQLLNSQVVGLITWHEKQKLYPYGTLILHTLVRCVNGICGLLERIAGRDNAIGHIAKAHTVADSNDRKKALSFYSQFITSGDLCFDVGANVGNRTDVFVELGARVVAVEPQDSCVQQLREKYQKSDTVTIIHKALGEHEGQAELMISNAHTISSLSKEWISSVKRSGRFSAYKWDKSVTVPVTTLDKLIEQYGTPVCCKIDVEGFEFQVLRGLSQPIPFISFEFTYPEYFAQARACMSYLCTLGEARFNLSVGETMSLVFKDWVTQEDVHKEIQSLRNKIEFGDIYVRYC